MKVWIDFWKKILQVSEPAISFGTTLKFIIGVVTYSLNLFGIILIRSPNRTTAKDSGSTLNVLSAHQDNTDNQETDNKFQRNVRHGDSYRRKAQWI